MTTHQIIKHIRDAIVQGKYPPKYKLVERELCTQLGANRNRLRKAFQQLNQEGFVTVVPFKGAYVVALTQKDVAQIYDLLGTLEGLSMRVAMRTITEGEIDAIEQLVENVAQTQADPVTIYESNIRLHRYMTDLGKNTRLISFTNTLRQQAYRMSLENFYRPGQISASLDEHDRILNAVKAGDPLLVENLIREHYVMSRDRLIRGLNGAL